MGFVFGTLARRALVGLTSVLVGGASLMALGAAEGAPAGAAVSSHAVLTANPTSLTFPSTTLGDLRLLPFLVTNTSASQKTIPAADPYSVSGADTNDFALVPATDCVTTADGSVVLAASASCHIFAVFFPGALGARSATITLNVVNGAAVSPDVSVSLSGTGTIGYYIASAKGAVANFGDAQSFGDASNLPLNHPIVGISQTGDNGGYWLVASDGGIFTYGDAQFYGSTGNIALNKPIVGMAGTADAGGYWLVASDGGIFSYGDAQFYGSTGNLTLNKPIVGMAPTPDGGGYWLVASDGGVFAYGDAQFYGSTGNIRLNQPIVGMAAMPTGNGYWFTAADGGLFNYGDAPFYGSAANQGLGTVVGMATDGAPTLQAFTDTPALRHALMAHGSAGWAPLPRGARVEAP